MEKSLYERYGNNEPYTEPDPESVVFWYAQETPAFFQLITGPSTNFYVGPDKAHYTIPKRLLYEFSAFAKPCLEGNFAEATANAIWLPDVSPDVFQWIWKWLYQGQLQIERYCYNLRKDEVDYPYIRTYVNPEEYQKACQLLCRVHILGERLLLDERFLRETVQEELGTLVERAKRREQINPFTPEIMQEVLSQSAPQQDYCCWADLSLRPILLQHLCDYEFCANMDFVKCSKCFELDGDFAAELMMYMAKQLVWAEELWGAQTESVVLVVDKRLELAEEEGNLQAMVKKPERCSDVWLALRYLCTFHGCTTAPFYEYSKCFELDGVFAAEILAYMAGELRWIREKWGEERGPRVNVAQERENEERNEREEDDMERLRDRNRYR